MRERSCPIQLTHSFDEGEDSPFGNNFPAFLTGRAYQPTRDQDILPMSQPRLFPIVGRGNDRPPGRAVTAVGRSKRGMIP